MWISNILKKVLLVYIYIYIYIFIYIYIYIYTFGLRIHDIYMTVSVIMDRQHRSAANLQHSLKLDLSKLLFKVFLCIIYCLMTTFHTILRI